MADAPSSSPSAGRAVAAATSGAGDVAPARPAATSLLGRTTALGGSATAALDAHASRKAAKAAAKPQPEVHVMGEIVGGTGFGEKAICCKWSVEVGDRWSWLEGTRSGQTHTVHSSTGSEFALWSHPLDLHFVAGTLHGWPQVLVQVFVQDSFGRLDCLGYGTAHIPPAPGSHDVSISVWRPVGSASAEMGAFFLGGNPTLASTAVVATALTDRHKLTTTGVGTVHLKVEVLVRHMDIYGVEW